MGAGQGQGAAGSQDDSGPARVVLHDAHDEVCSGELRRRRLQTRVVAKRRAKWGSSAHTHHIISCIMINVLAWQWHHPVQS